MNVYDNFTQCYLGLIDQVYNTPDFISSPRGQLVKEKLAVKFQINDPRSRIPYTAARKFSLHYMVAELLWYLSGEDSTEWISNYSSFWRKISDNGKTANSAYGARIFKTHDRIAGGQLVQWDYVVNELRKDNDSRRAVIHIRSPWDSTHAKLDVPCTLALQFFIRDNKLHLVVNMRSSDIILGIAYDIPAFTFMQELMAVQLGVGLGTYTHISNSLHIYERHFNMAEEILLPENQTESLMCQISRGSMPPLTTNLPPIRELYLFEGAIRNCSTAEEIYECLEELETIDIHIDHIDYWLDWGKVLASHRLKKLGFLNESNDMLNSTSYVGYHLLS
tara:strand:+ start:15704 stop:16705 length:1002 start_codon:yes stop_codon:yes gene_type:complete